MILKFPARVLVLLAVLVWAESTSAQAAFELITNEAWIDFPESVDFHLAVTADSPITTAQFEYGIDAQSCGEVTAVTEPTFEPATELDLTWRWPILETTFVPPGGQIWWRWHLTTAEGDVFTTPRQTATFLDSWFVWQEKTAENVTVYWYRGPNRLGEQILDAALEAIDVLALNTGLRLTEPVSLYLYDESFDLQASLPGAPAWAGGAAFPEHNIILIATNADQLEYGITTTRHEMGHLVTGRLTFNCTNTIPTWLNEGLAMVAEGEQHTHALETLAEAVTDPALLTIPQLEGGFSVHTDRALLSYAQSYSLVQYLIDTHGPAKMLALLQTFQAGATPDDALLATYGFDTRGLENAWRASIGAAARSETAEDSSTPTPVPTMALLNPTMATTAVPTAPSTPSPQPEATIIPKIITEAAPPTPTLTTTTKNDPHPPTTASDFITGPVWLEFCLFLLVITIVGTAALLWYRRHN